ncbi:DUF2624 family protein [Aureibacillus halotolerans]|uniref:Uncharacterized protein DUF2624 n=1 Tax=Aureibacillus halotolerans TaxID=1508390 RepID=A0A4V3D5Z2_9BACI|nr:DUF2624 family protein [Aureibacillus halotolerans]TDQ41717.1 uncharacterized protein DUF2624 [Aureibacillus halotolerans]
MFVKKIVNQKLRRISPKELLKYAKNYQINLTEPQAEKIATIFHQQPNLDVYDVQQRSKLLKTISERVGPSTAAQLEQLFVKLTSSS